MYILGVVVQEMDLLRYLHKSNLSS